MHIYSSDENFFFLHKLVTVGRSKKNLVSYLDRGSRHLHDTVLSKFINAFFATLPSTNVLSTNSESSSDQKTYFDTRVDQPKEHYMVAGYERAWRSACITARLDILTAAGTT